MIADADNRQFGRCSARRGDWGYGNGQAALAAEGEAM